MGDKAMAMEPNAMELASGTAERGNDSDDRLEVEESNGTEFQFEVSESEVERQIDQCVIQLQTYAMIMTAALKRAEYNVS